MMLFCVSIRMEKNEYIDGKARKEGYINLYTFWKSFYFIYFFVYIYVFLYFYGFMSVCYFILNIVYD